MHRGAGLIGRIGDVRKLRKRDIGCKWIHVVVTAGDRERNAGSENARAVERPFRERIAQGDGTKSEIVRAGIADGRKSTAQIRLRVLQADQRFLRRGAPQASARGEIVPVGLEVDVTVDQPRKHGRAAEIDDGVPSGAVRAIESMRSP